MSLEEQLIENCKIGDIDNVKKLFNDGADIHARNDLSLIMAAENGHLEIVMFLIENDADIHTENDLSLIIATVNGHLEVVKFLVENDADIHARNEALRNAAKNGHSEILKFLVENGANIHVRNDYALKWAVKNKHYIVIDFLLFKCNKNERQKLIMEYNIKNIISKQWMKYNNKFKK